MGTNGVSVELSTPVFNPWINLRAGVDIMPDFKFTSDADIEFQTTYGATDGSIDLDGKLGRTQGHIIFDINPIPGARSFHVSVGGYFGGNKLVKINGFSQELADYSAATGNTGSVVIGDYLIPTDGKGNVRGGLKVNSFRPYFGIGFGNAIPGRLVNFAVDLGIQIEGKPELYTDYGVIDASAVEDNNTFNKIRKALSVYPVLNFRVNFKTF